jgi:hypothetical protein
MGATNLLILFYLGLCGAQNNGDLRLLQGDRSSPSFSAGRLEIFINATWGSVCADNFNKTDADVACKQLGYEGAVSTDTSFHTPYGRGLAGPVWLDEVNCNGELLHLLSCANDGIGEHDCDHFSDVAVVCIDQPRPAVPQPMDVRLSGGEFKSEGRVEVYCSGQWTAVCDQLDFQQTEADAVCRQLGYTEAVSFDANVAVTDLQVPQWQGQLSCGNETDNIASCGECNDADISSVNPPGCLAVTVRCAHTVPYGSLRLVRDREMVDADITSGRLEIFQNGEWGTVCSETFSLTAANISCQELGFLRTLHFRDSIEVGFGVGSDSDQQTGFECDEDDQRLIQCSTVPEDPGDLCTHSQDVALFCTNSPPVMPATGTAPPEERSPLPTSTLVGILVGCFLGLLVICTGLGVFSAHFYLVPYSLKKERHSLYFVEREREGSAEAEAETRIDQKFESRSMDSLGKNLVEDFASRPRAKNRYVSLDTSRPDMIVDTLADPSAQEGAEVAESSVPQPAQFSAIHSSAMPSPGPVSVHSLHILPDTPRQKHRSTSRGSSLSPAGSLNSIGAFSFTSQVQYSPSSSQPDIAGPIPISAPIPPPLKHHQASEGDGDSPQTTAEDRERIKRGLISPSYKSELQDQQVRHLPQSEYSGSVQSMHQQQPESPLTSNQTASSSSQQALPRGIMKSPKSAAKAARSMPHLEQRRASEQVTRESSGTEHNPTELERESEDQQNHNHHVSFLLD